MTPSGTRLLLLVDTEPAQQRLISALAARTGWRTIIAGDAEAAVATLGTRDGMMLDAILIDQAIPGDDVATLIGDIRDRRPLMPVLILTAVDADAGAVEAIRSGATDFIVKPIGPHRLLAALDAVAKPEGYKAELRPLTEKIVTPLGFGEIVGSDPKFRASLAVAAKAARARVPVLIEGESGVGKEVVAGAIHASSPREKKPFIAINCGEIPANLIDSELFGHEKGAFTGAFARHVGKLRDADGGTIFIDEIEKMPPDAQLRLLRFIESGEVHPIGARGFSEVDVRVVAAANARLLDAVQANRFREDLYYKLATVLVPIPPLRERSGDIPALARHLLTRTARLPGMRELGITEEALSLLCGYAWDGNVRQLQNALFRASVRCAGDALTAADFPEIASTSVGPATTAHPHEAGITLYQPDGHLRPLEAIEADVIRLAIGHYRGRMTEVARRLGIGRSTLYRKLAELGIGDAA
jgi:DNA-binding NtrC family response regulator